MGGTKDKVTQVEVPKVEAPGAADIARQQAEAFNVSLQNLQSQFPQQFGLGEQRAGTIAQALGQTQFMSPEEQSAQESIRGRQRSDLSEALRTRANLGGGLFGGREAGTEERAMRELSQAFAQLLFWST